MDLLGFFLINENKAFLAQIIIKKAYYLKLKIWLKITLDLNFGSQKKPSKISTVRFY